MKTPDFEKMTKEEIDQWATDRGVNLDRRKSKEGLIKEVNAAIKAGAVQEMEEHPVTDAPGNPLDAAHMDTQTNARDVPETQTTELHPDKLRDNLEATGQLPDVNLTSSDQPEAEINMLPNDSSDVDEDDLQTIRNAFNDWASKSGIAMSKASVENGPRPNTVRIRMLTAHGDTSDILELKKSGKHVTQAEAKKVVDEYADRLGVQA